MNTSKFPEFEAIKKSLPTSYTKVATSSSVYYGVPSYSYTAIIYLNSFLSKLQLAHLLKTQEGFSESFKPSKFPIDEDNESSFEFALDSDPVRYFSGSENTLKELGQYINSFIVIDYDRNTGVAEVVLREEKEKDKVFYSYEFLIREIDRLVKEHEDKVRIANKVGLLKYNFNQLNKDLKLELLESLS